MRRSRFWSGLLVAAAATSSGDALACSCIAPINGAPPSYEVWPRRGDVPTDAHFWVHRRIDAELELFVGGIPQKTEVRRMAEGWFDVASTLPLPKRSRVELRARRPTRTTVLAEVDVLDGPGGKLPAGGELSRIVARDGNELEPCSNGSPKATAEFAPFATRPAMAAVPYAVWFSLDPAPLALDRPPDRIVLVEQGQLTIDGGNRCVPGDYWLPMGTGGMKLAAAAIDTDGTQRPPVVVAFRGAIDASAQKIETDQCIGAAKRASDEVRKTRDGAEDAMLTVANDRRRALWLTIVVGGVGLLVGGMGLVRRRRLPWPAVALSALSLAPLGAAARWNAASTDARARLSQLDQQVGAHGETLKACYTAYPRRP